MFVGSALGCILRKNSRSGLVLAAALMAPAAMAETMAPPTGQATIIAAPATPGAPQPNGVARAVLPSLADIVERVSSGVVSLSSKRGLGSGFVIDPSGYIVTNNHVIAGATEIDVRFSNNRKLKARIIGTDPATDIALLKIDGAGPLASVKFADDRRVRVGDWVLAVGNPFGFNGTVTAGIVSARGRDEVGSAQFTDYLQVDAAITSGNSGGPTFDMSGRVIGMNTLGYVTSTGERIGGIGFAIPASTIQRVVQDLRATGSVTRGYLGVQIETLSDDAARALGLPNAEGALVTDVIPGSPAEKGGFKRGDVVLKMNGQSIKDNRDLSRRIAALEVGQTAKFTVWRENQQITLTVTVAKRDQVAMNDVPGAPGASANLGVNFTSLGLGLKTITPEVGQAFALASNAAGVLITDIDFSSDAAERGLRPGDRIVAVGGDDVKSLGDLNLAVEQAKSLKRPSVLLFVVTKSGRQAHVTINLDKN
jgi:serine protease Do